jgi:hypothetical protein
MGKKQENASIRVRSHTATALREAAYGAPFYCKSIATFLCMVERGDVEAVAAWQREAKKLARDDK